MVANVVIFKSSSDKEIEALYQAVVDSEQNTSQRYYDLGMALRQRRSEFEKGTWEVWLRERGIHPRRAQRAIQIAEKYDDREALKGVPKYKALGYNVPPKVEVDGQSYDVMGVDGSIVMAKDSTGSTVPFLRGEVIPSEPKPVPKPQAEQSDPVEMLEFQLSLAEARIKVLEQLLGRVLESSESDLNEIRVTIGKVLGAIA